MVRSSQGKKEIFCLTASFHFQKSVILMILIQFNFLYIFFLIYVFICLLSSAATECCMKFDSEPALLNHCRLVHEPPTTTSDGCPQARPPSLASPPPVPASLPPILSPPPTNQRAGFAPSMPTPVKKTPQATPPPLPPPPVSTGKEGRQRSSGRRSAVSERFQLQPGQ
jgi:hypothetical protein